MHALDQTDWEIITLLNEDGRMSSTEIAERLDNVSARTVNNRIRALTKDGIITIRAVVNPDKVGFEVLADVYIETEPGLAREVGYKLAEYPEISYVACVVGNVDVSCSVRSRTISELFDFLEAKIAKIEGVRRTQTYLLPYKIKEIDTWLPTYTIEMGGNENQAARKPVAAD